MVDLGIQINTIQDKLQQLLKQYELLQKENRRLTKELEKATQAGSENERQMERFQQQLDAVKLGGVAWNATDKEAMEKRINAYLKEIDKCLALLNT